MGPSRFAAGAAVVIAAASVVAVAVVASVAGARGRGGEPRQAPPRETAAAFMTRVVHLIGANRYSEAWRLLHPAQRRSAGLEEYVVCELRTPVPGRVDAVRVLGVTSEPALLAPGLRVPSAAVQVEIRIGSPAFSRPAVVDDRVHAVRVGSAWAWLLPPDRLARYAANRCPAGDGPPAAKPRS